MRGAIVASVLLAFVVFQGCADGGRKYSVPKFGEVTSAQFRLLSEEQMWGGVTSIYRYKGIVAVMAYDFCAPSSFLHFFSLNGEHLDDMVLAGRGPFEMQSTPKTFLRDSTLYLVDAIGRKQISVNLERVVEQKYGACCCEDLDLDILCIYAECLSNGDSLFIFHPDPSGASADDPRIRLVSGGKSVVCTSSPYSALSTLERGYFEYPTSKFAVSPDGSRLAIAIGNGAILETYGISRAGIKSIATKYFVEPKYDMTATSIGTNVQTIAGFGYLYGTNDRIYSVYDGENTYKDKSKMLFKNIAVFDWKGNALKEIRTDYRISSMYTDDGKEFYAVVEDKDRRPYVAKLVVE